MKQRLNDLKEASEARTQRLIAIHDCNDPEFKRLKAEEENAKFPYTAGQDAAYYAWDRSIRMKSSELEADDLPYKNQMSDFVKTLREAGFTEIVVTDTNSDLISGLYELTRLGCTMKGMCEITRGINYYGEEETVCVRGIRFGL